jgi:heme oxygenase
MNLREATAEKHKIAEKMPFNQRMMQKQLSKLDYLNYINQHFEIFTAIEANDLPHPSLNRTQLISLDIQELQLELKSPNVVLNSTKLYVAYLQNLSYQDLLPHIYLNYLAVMFGGQIIKKVVPSTGNMYEFENMNEAASTIRALQKDEWADEVNKGFDFNIAILEELELNSLSN